MKCLQIHWRWYPSSPLICKLKSCLKPSITVSTNANQSAASSKLVGTTCLLLFAYKPSQTYTFSFFFGVLGGVGALNFSMTQLQKKLSKWKNVSWFLHSSKLQINIHKTLYTSERQFCHCRIVMPFFLLWVKQRSKLLQTRGFK